MAALCALQALLMSLLPGLSEAAEPANVAHVTAELVAERVAAVPGSDAWLGLRLRHAPHWHTYWINPGDSGLPTKLLWTLPDHSHASDVAWPAPQRFTIGELSNFGFDGDVVLPVQVSVPDSAEAGSTMRIQVTAKWLECEEQCIPGKATLSLDLPIAKTAVDVDSRWASLFDAARARQPRPMQQLGREPQTWNGSAVLRGDRVIATITGSELPSSADLDVFPLEPAIVANAAPQIERSAGALIVTMKKSDDYAKTPQLLTLVLVTRSGEPAQAWRVSLPFRELRDAQIGQTATSDSTTPLIPANRSTP